MPITRYNLPKRNYNIFALQGDETTDDMDVVETLGLDPQVAYTPDINMAAAKAMRAANINSYLKQGMEQLQAHRLAEQHYQAQIATLRSLGAEVKL